MSSICIAFRSLAKSMGLVINKNKTDFMAVGSNYDNISNTLIDGYNFERVKRFIHLGTYVDAENNCTK